MTKGEFVRKAVLRHGHFYSYEALADSFLSTEKVVVVCPEHGEFRQLAATHLRGCGCSACKGVKPYTTETFIAKLKTFLGDSVGYDKVVFTSPTDPVTLVCPAHGDYSAIPRNLIANRKGGGCPGCLVDGRRERRKRTRGQFDRAVDKHFNGRYTFLGIPDDVVTDDCNITLVCPKHGKISKSARSVALGNGCPKCHYDNMPGGIGGYSEGLFRARPELRDEWGCLYYVRLCAGDEAFYKVGITKVSLKQRKKGFKPYQVECLAALSGDLYSLFKIEQELLSDVARSYQPTHKFEGWTECHLENLLPKLRSFI